MDFSDEEDEGGICSLPVTLCGTANLEAVF